MNYFPEKIYEDAGAFLDAYLDRVRLAAASVSREKMRAAAELLEATVARDGTIFSCGNGGSAAIANHLACDGLKGVREDTAIRPRLHSLSATLELMTAIANDIGYSEIFSYQLSSLARPGDLLIAISASGDSPNVVGALAWARRNGLPSIAMTGFQGGKSAELADVNLHVDGHNYGVVEDVHQSLMHALVQYARHQHFDDPQLLGQKKF